MENKEKDTVETNVSTDNANNTETVNDSVDDAVREKKSIKKASNKKVITFTSICVIVVAIIILMFSLKGCTGCTTSVSSTTPIASASSKVTASASPTPSATPSATPTITPTATPEETTTPEEATADTGSSDNGQTAVAPVQPEEPAQSNSNSGCTVVHHEATGHYETNVVSAAYDEQVVATPAQQVPYYVCSDGTIFNTSDEADIYLLKCGKGNYSEAWKTNPATYTTVHHDAVTNQVWVVDSNAYDTCE